MGAGLWIAGRRLLLLLLWRPTPLKRDAQWLLTAG